MPDDVDIAAYDRRRSDKRLDALEQRIVALEMAIRAGFSQSFDGLGHIEETLEKRQSQHDHNTRLIFYTTLAWMFVSGILIAMMLMGAV